MFEIEQFICIKMDLVLNNPQKLICHKTQTNKQTNKQIIKNDIWYFVVSIKYTITAGPRIRWLCPLQKGKIPLKKDVLDMICIWWWGSSLAITPISTLI